jgi:hypothetical protein
MQPVQGICIPIEMCIHLITTLQVHKSFTNDDEGGIKYLHFTFPGVFHNNKYGRVVP